MDLSLGIRQHEVNLFQAGPRKPVDRAQQYRDEADVQRRIARSYEGCSWMGKEHPKEQYERRARMLEEATLMYEKFWSGK